MKNNKLWLVLIVIMILLVVGYFYVYKKQGKSITTKTYTPTTSISSDVIMTKTDVTKGDYLAGANGMTLYVFDKDQPNISNCSGGCATIWPAYTTTTVPSTLPTSLTVFTRPDRVIQYAYNNKPLYYYAPDKQPTDTLGDGVGGVWHLVKF